MNIGLLYPIKERKETGVRNLIKGTIKETLNMDNDNKYYLLEEPYFETETYTFPLVRWGGSKEESQKYDFQCYLKNIDIMHSYWNTFEEMNSKCLKVFTIYDLIPLIHPEWHTLHDYFDGPVRKSVEQADFIISISEYTKKDIVEHYGISAEKIKVIYPGLQQTLNFNNDYIGVLEKYKLEEGYLLAVGTLEPRKNLRGLINSFILYKKMRPKSKIKLVITGMLGWDQNFENEIESIGEYRNEIVLTGFVDDKTLSDLYKRAIAIAYVSLYEGFGLPILEAMSAGKTVITSEVTSMPEVGGDAVLYCNPYNNESIADAIMKIIENQELRRQLEKKSLEQAKKFSYEKAAKETIEIYSKLKGWN